IIAKKPVPEFRCRFVQALAIRLRIFESSAVDEKNVGPSVVVVIEDGDSAPHCLDQVLPGSWRIAEAEVQARGGGGFDVGGRRLGVKETNSGCERSDYKDSCSDLSHGFPNQLP